MTKRDIIYLVGIAVLLLLLLRQCSISEINERIADNRAAITDSLKRSVNKLGQETVSKDAIIVANKKELKELEGISKEFDNAIKEVRKTRGELQYYMSLATRTKTTVQPEVYIDTTLSDRPIAEALVISYHDEWVDVRYSMQDSLQIDITNVYSFKQVEKNPWFKPSSTMVEVTNLNPYTVTEELITIDVKPPIKRTHLAATAGACMDATGRIIPCVGVGVAYSLKGIK